MLRNPLCQKDCQRNLYAVRQNKREYAPAQRGHQANCTSGTGVYQHKPGSTKGIAHNKSQCHGKDHHRQLIPEEVSNGPVQQCGKQKSDDVAAGCSQQYPNAAAESGKDRDTDCT